MKHLKSLFFKIKSKKTLKTYQKPLLITLLTLLFINIFVILIGTGIALLLDSKYFGSEFFEGSFFAALITVGKWMVSPNSISNLKEVPNQWIMSSLAIVIVVVGMVLFSGAIIATVTTALRSYIDKKSHAKGKILIHDHFVILNWNSKVPDMIFNLMLKGFKNNIVILSEYSKDYIESEIKSLFLTNEVKQKYKTNLIIKEGDSLLRSNLEDISIEGASQICIMARDDMVDAKDDDILNSDLLNLKIVLRLGSFNINKDCQIVVETDSDETRGHIENLSYTVNSLKGLNIIPVSFNKKIGQIIAKSLVTPKVSGLYTDLFSFDGPEFYSIESEESIDEYMKTHTDSIPVYKDSRLFVLAEDENEIPKKRGNVYSNNDKFVPVEGESTTAAAVFIIGDNSKKEFLMDNLRKIKADNDVQFEIFNYSKQENARLVEDIRKTPGPKKVLILSDDTVEPESYDANVFVTLIELSKAFPKKENITYITELLDSRNLSSIKDFDIQNTIISNKMMSLLITQLAMNKGSKKFFERILTTANVNQANDFELIILPVCNVIEINEPRSFQNKAELLRTFYNTFEGKKILIGMYRENKLTLFNREQDKMETITLQKDDQLVFLKYN